MAATADLNGASGRDFLLKTIDRFEERAAEKDEYCMSWSGPQDFEVGSDGFFCKAPILSEERITFKGPGALNLTGGGGLIAPIIDISVKTLNLGVETLYNGKEHRTLMHFSDKCTIVTEDLVIGNFEVFVGNANPNIGDEITPEDFTITCKRVTFKDNKKPDCWPLLKTYIVSEYELLSKEYPADEEEDISAKFDVSAKFDAVYSKDPLKAHLLYGGEIKSESSSHPESE